MRRQAEAIRRPRGLHQVLDRPLLPLGRLTANLVRRKGVEGVVVGRIYRDELGGHVTASSVIARPWLFAVPLNSSQ